MVKAKVKKKHRKNPKRLIIPIYLIVLAVTIICVYAFPSLSGAMSETMTVEYGTISTSYDATFYIIRDEKVYFSGSDGSVTYHFAEGAGVRSGTQVVTVDTAGAGAGADVYSAYNRQAADVRDMSAVLSDQGRLDSVKAELAEARSALDEDDTEGAEKIDRYLDALDKLSGDGGAPDAVKGAADGSDVDTSFGVTGSIAAAESGTLSYVFDGYENVLNPYTMALLDREKLERLDFETSSAASGSTRKNEPLFKVTDRKKWYAVTWVPESALGKFSEGSSVSLNLPKGSVDGKISRLYDNGDEIMVVLEFRNYYEDMASLRKIETELTVSAADGLMVDSSYIVSEDGVPGVYVVGVTGNMTFTPVKILASDGENTIVASEYYYEQSDGETKQVATVSPYDEIKKVDRKDVKSSS